MLHNSGSYGPSDNPINMVPPINIPQISTGADVGQNLSNFNKIAQQTPQMLNGQFNIPNYQPYSHPTLNLSTHLNSYSSYNSMAYHDSYSLQNTSPFSDLSWQNNVMPMNLNTHVNRNNDLSNFQSDLDKKARDVMFSNEVTEDCVKEKNLPINIPQRTINSFQSDANSEKCSMYNINQDKFNNFSQNLDLSTKSQEKPLLDSSKRKTLENTVRLIETILNNTSKIQETQHNENNESSRKDTEKTENIYNTPNTTETQNPTLENEEQNNNSDSESMTMERTDSDIENAKDIQPDNTKQQESLPENETTEITVKIEVDTEAYWTDTEYNTPFLRDLNGVTRDDVMDSTIVDCENSVNEAIAVVKSGLNPKSHYECPHCNLFFDHPKRFLIHTKWHSFGLTYEKRTELARERESKKNQRKEARFVDRLKSKLATKKETTSNVTFPCKECDKVYLSKSSLKNHRSKDHPRRTRECTICGQSVIGWLAMRSHLAEHSASGFQCNDCGKVFKYSHSLAKHRDTHLEKTLSCHQCPKKFGTPTQLKMHQKVHERAQRGTTYVCSMPGCSKAFYEAYNLAIHERTHRNERPFQCDICNSSFITNSSLKRHKKVSHNTSKPFECSTCHRSFVSEMIKNRHIVRAHADPEDFKFACTLCECRYTKQINLQKHMNKVHPKRKRKEKDNE